MKDIVLLTTAGIMVSFLAYSANTDMLSISQPTTNPTIMEISKEKRGTLRQYLQQKDLSGQTKDDSVRIIDGDLAQKSNECYRQYEKRKSDGDLKQAKYYLKFAITLGQKARLPRSTMDKYKEGLRLLKSSDR